MLSVFRLVRAGTSLVVGPHCLWAEQEDDSSKEFDLN